MVTDLSSYIPIDRRHALARSKQLPERASGAALFADVVGFTVLAEALVRELGARRGAEELTAQLNRVYESLIGAVHRFRGSVVGFSGDAITCWFDDAGIGSWGLGDGEVSPAPTPSTLSPATLRAVACGLAMQRSMRQLTVVATPAGALVTLAIKVAVASGSVRRFLVGSPSIQLLDVLAGRTLDRLAAAEHSAESGEIVVDAQTAELLGDAVLLAGWRADEHGNRQAALIASLAQPIAPSPWPALPTKLGTAQIRPWLAPAVAARLDADHAPFLAELRPAVALMLQFGGIDYDHDENAGAQLDSFIRQVQRLVARYDGHVLDVTIGDKGSYLYIVFGAPVAHDNDAAQAVASALELRQAAPDVRIGIAGGQMRCGAYGSGQRRTYGVLGDKTNLAARLMGLAETGAIVCDDTIYRQARRQWQFVALPPVRVKGKAGPIAVYRPTGRPANSAAPAATTILIGRQAEIEYLHECLDAIARGESRILILEGEAGIGKSRLITALGELLHERGMVGLSGSAYSLDQAAYRAWRSIFSAFFGLEAPHAADPHAGQPTPSPQAGAAQPGAAPTATRSPVILGTGQVNDPLERWERVRMHALAVVPDLVERLPLLNDVLGLGLPDSDHTRALDIGTRAERLSELLIELLRAWANEQPLVLVLEDAQHLDTRARQLAVQIGRSFSAAGIPLLLVVAVRTLDTAHPALGHITALLSLANARLVNVAPLSPAEITALVAARLEVALPDLPDEVGELVRARSEGNPLFAEELTATLREQGLIRIEQLATEGQGERLCCVIAGNLQQASQALPDEIQGLLLARIDRLPPEERLTLKVAAVIGPSFDYQPLRYARNQQAPIDEPTLKNHLGALAAQHFTELETPEPSLIYRFKHALTQEATYQTLLYAQRRELHRAVAEWHERTFGRPDAALLIAETGYSSTPYAKLTAHNSALAPYIGLLAFHYRRAEDRERERRYVELLGEQSFNIGAFREAISCFERALELTPRDIAATGAWSAQLHAQMARAYMHLRDRTTAQRLYRQSLALAETAGDQAGAALACYELGSLADQRGAHAEALEYFERALGLYRATNDLAGAGRALDRLGGVYVELGDEARALACYQEAITLGRRRGV
jgi:class 3 adenylate cyclase/tetratricopeptide (TPR) repeat protein